MVYLLIRAHDNIASRHVLLFLSLPPLDLVLYEAVNVLFPVLSFNSVVIPFLESLLLLLL